jgi:hypothetical protein
MLEEWDRDQARGLRDTVYPLLARMPDGAAIRAIFDRALFGDASAVPELIAFVANENDEVSRSALKLLGRFADPRAAATLKQTLAQDPRVRMRAIALASLGRMRDAEAATLAIAALTDADDYMKAAGGTALGLIGDSKNAPAVLSYLDSMAARGVLDTGAFDVLAELGDAPGSTAVRDRLLAEANTKTNDFADRLDAAVALKKMGLEHLVVRILDRQKAQVTNNKLIVLRGLVDELAIKRGIALGDQSRLNAVLGQVDDQKYRSDSWGRPLTAKFVSVGIFNVISDGPDQTPGTVDDMSTAETFRDYEKRVFADLF